MVDFDGKTVGEIREMAREGAAEILKSYWDFQLPVKVIKIARALGASVFTAQLGDDVYGMLKSEPGGPSIYLDEDQPNARMRFTCAHEIGHLYSHLGDDRDFVDARSNAGRGTASEIYANEFAGNLLMPKQCVEEMLAEGIPPIQMAEKFGVSLAAMGYRLKVLRSE